MNEISCSYILTSLEGIKYNEINKYFLHAQKHVSYRILIRIASMIRLQGHTKEGITLSEYIRAYG